MLLIMDHEMFAKNSSRIYIESKEAKIHINSSTQCISRGRTPCIVDNKYVICEMAGFYTYDLKHSIEYGFSLRNCCLVQNYPTYHADTPQRRVGVRI